MVSALIICLFSLVLASDVDYKIDTNTSKAIPTFAGQIIKSKGYVFRIDEKGKESKVIKGGKIFSKDKIVTKKNSFLQIEMVDDTLVTLGPHSTLILEKFDFKDKKERVATFNVVKGQFRSHFQNKAKEGDLTVKTSTVSMGVRGTQVLVNSFRDKNDEPVAQFALVKGKINLLNKVSKKTYEIKPTEHYVSVGDSLESKTFIEKNLKLNQETLKNLNTEMMDPSEDFFPLLKMIDTSKFTASRSPSSISAPVDEVLPEKNIRQQTQSWKKNLDLLNKKLDEYNSKTIE